MMSTQCKFTLTKIGSNLDENHHVFYLKCLIELFKLVHPEMFKNKRLGCKRTYGLDELLGLNTWGDFNNHESCRDKAQLCKNNDESVQVLISGQPSKSTINDFTNHEADLINAFDDFIVDFCDIAGLVEGKTFTTDGTVLDSYSNDFKGLYPDEIKYLEDFLTQTNTHKHDYELLFDYYHTNNESTYELAQILGELENNLNIHSINLILRALKNEKEYRGVMCKLRHMGANITKNNIKVSIVDPDAHYMKDKDNLWGFRYNFQETTDAKHGIIVDHYVTKNPNDKKEVKTVVDRLITKFGDNDFSLCLDHGYWNIRLLIDIIRETSVNLIIPDKKSATETKEKIIKDNKSNKRYKEYMENKNKNKKHRTFLERKDFIYVEEEDAYRCPKTQHLLEFQGTVENKNGVKYRRYYTNKCKKCHYNHECTSQSKRILQDINEPEIQTIQELYNSEKGQKIYPLRGSYSEGNFGDLSEARNFRGIKVRGQTPTDNQLTRTIIIHNTKKIEKHMELDVLKKILRYIENINIYQNEPLKLLRDLKGKFIEENGKIIDVKI